MASVPLVRRAIVLATLTLSIIAVGAGPAQAASAAWKLLAGTAPTNLPTTQSQVDRIAVEAGGGTFTLTTTFVEGQGTLDRAEGVAEVAEGSNIAHMFFAFEGTFEVGQTLIGEGIPAGTTIVGVTGGPEEFELELSNKATESTAGFYEGVTKEVSAVTTPSGAFVVGEGLAGPGVAPGTTISAVGNGTLTLSAYPTGGGAVALRGTGTATGIPYDAPATALQAALESLPGYSAGVLTVSGGPGGDLAHPYFLAFGGALADKKIAGVAVDGSALEGAHHAAYLFTATPGGPGTGDIAIMPANVGGAATSGQIEVSVGPLPTGIVTSGPGEDADGSAEGWSCPGGRGASAVTCSLSVSVQGLKTGNGLLIPIEVLPGAAAESNVPISISGGGATAATYEVSVVVSNQPAPAGVQAFWAGAFDADGNLETQAGIHPASAQTNFIIDTVRSASGQIIPAGDPKDVDVDLPPGFLGNPTVTPRCPQAELSPQVTGEACSREMSVGSFLPYLSQPASAGLESHLFNDVPAKGYAAEFSTVIASPEVHTFGSLRSSEDFGVQIDALNSPTYDKVYGAYVALENEPQGAHGKAFLTNPTSCGEEAREAPVASISANTWQEQGTFSSPVQENLPAVTGCDKLEFTPSFSFQPTSSQGSSGVGATAHLHIPQESLTDPAKLAQPELKKAVVTLPQALSLNASSANGLQACSEEQVGYVGPGALPNPTRFNEAAPSCPDGSKLGTFEVKTPLLEDQLEGTVYLAAQEENPFHSLLAIYLVVDDPKTGVVLKLPGEVTPDPTTGQLTATFDYNPQVPFEDLTLHFRGGGPRSELATPEVCGHYETTGSLTPWSAPESGPAAQIKEAGFTVSGSCAPSAATRPFSPSFEAGTTSPVAGSYSPLVIKVNRNDGEQELTKLDFTLPEGLVADLASVPYCSDAGIDAARTKTGRAEQASPSCPSASQLGTVDTAAGVGSEPVHVGGHVYLAGPYEGAPLSAVVITPAVAGPFDLGDVVVRAPLFIDPATTRVTAKSDPIPTILKGIQLKLRSVTVTLDRPGFTLNPTSCDAMSVTASLSSSDGATAAPANHFQVGNCSGLQFKPSLTASTKGKASKVNGASLTVKIAAKPGEANIHKVNLQLPVTLPSRLSTLQKACTEAVFNANPASCQGDSVIGSGTAHTPILQAPLTGPAYLVSHGGAAFPDVEFVLQAAERGGDIEVILDGNTQIKKGITYSNFETVPDAPISTFESTFPQGPHSILGAFVPASANYSLCGQTLRIPTTLTAQNGAVVKQSTAIAVTGCAPAIMVKSHRVSGRTATLVLQVPSAGKLIASGTGLTTAKKSVTKATSVTLKVSLSSKERTFLARHPHRKVKLRVKLRFTPKKGAPLSNAVTVLIG
jgi:hypothetical protein